MFLTYAFEVTNLWNWSSLNELHFVQDVALQIIHLRSHKVSRTEEYIIIMKPAQTIATTNIYYSTTYLQYTTYLET